MAMSSSLGAANMSRPSSSERIRPSLRTGRDTAAQEDRSDLAPWQTALCQKVCPLHTLTGPRCQAVYSYFSEP